MEDQKPHYRAPHNVTGPYFLRRHHRVYKQEPLTHEHAQNLVGQVGKLFESMVPKPPSHLPPYAPAPFNGFNNSTPG